MPPDTRKNLFSQPTRAHPPLLAFSAETTIKQDLHGLPLHHSLFLVTNHELTPSAEANLKQDAKIFSNNVKIECSRIVYRLVLVAMIGVGSLIARLVKSKGGLSLSSMSLLPIMSLPSGMDTRNYNNVLRMALIATGTRQTR